MRGRKLGWFQETNSAKSVRMEWLPTMAEKIVDKIWTTMNWAIHDGEVLVMRALRRISGWRATS